MSGEALTVHPADPLDRIDGMEEAEIADRIDAIRTSMGSSLLILGHHYQRDSIIRHADLTGDSFQLSEMAAKADAKHIVFCGVHFMAESADILTRDEQSVTLPNLRAGCSMADMADVGDVLEAWMDLLEHHDLKDPASRSDPEAPAGTDEGYLVPVTYMNSSAELKAFVGEHGGVVCTSSNARGVLTWALERAGGRGKVLFFPDQHLGRNTGLAMGIPAEAMTVWTPSDLDDGTIDRAAIDASRLILWHGFCSVHKRFTVDQIDRLRRMAPEAVVVVHPECTRDVVEAADANGSTGYIRTFVADQPPGAVIGVGTEINLVDRLNEEHPDKTVLCLDPFVCPCSTMYMIHPMYLLDVLERLDRGDVPNRIVVPQEVQSGARLALDRMLAIIQ